MNEPLRFTGNWFIDAGILGFVNLMEDIYGWDLKELQRRLREEPEKVYYGYFPFAYLFYHSRYHKFLKDFRNARNEVFKLKEKQESEKKTLKELEMKLKTTNTKAEYKKIEKGILKTKKKLRGIETKLQEATKKIEVTKEEFIRDRDSFRQTIEASLDLIIEDSTNDFQNVVDIISKAIPNFDLQLPKDHRNFFLYNPKKDLGTSYKYLFWLLKEDREKLRKIKKGKEPTYEIRPDSTINPFLHSPVEFPNVSYTKPLSTLQLKGILPQSMPPYIVFLSFSNAFQYVVGSYVMIYIPNLETCYGINKRLKVYIESTRGEHLSLFRMTWSAIIDELIETKARFSLENLYLVEFEDIENQKLKNVEYIGIPKLHASILLDDTIRDALNTSIGIGDSWKWLLEEFLKQKPLYPLVQMHLWFAIKTGSTANSRTLLYALAVDAKLKEQAKCRLIFKPVFESPDRVVQDIQEFYERMNLARLNISRALGEEGKRYIHPLFSALRKHNRNAFMNIFLKALTQAKEKETVKYLTSYLINRILLNDSAWEDFALALLVGLVGGGLYAGSGGESSED